jgi:hypothetical protein
LGANGENVVKYWTYKEIKDKIRRDLGIQQETFITPDELLGYVNAGIDEAEAEIHTLYEDYFLTRSDKISLTVGQTEVPVPSNIYGLKIRGIIYNDGTDVYTVKRFKNTEAIYEKLEYQDLVEDDVYQYAIINNMAANGVLQLPVITLVPKVYETKPDALRIYYLRNANRMEDDSSYCDIPEFVHFVIQYAKVRCYEKEGDPRLGAALQMLEHFRNQMINTLSNMTPDGENEIEKDMTFYWEMGVEENP